MQRNQLCFVLVLVCIAAIALACVSEVSAQNIDKGRISDLAKKLIGDNVKGLVQARKAFNTDYTYLIAKNLGSEYATEVSNIMLPMLESQKNSQKQINLAITLSEIPEPALQKAYEVMVAHKNPGVRYLGWRGYGRIWTDILADTNNPAGQKLLLASLEKACMQENNVLLLTRIVEILPFTPPARITIAPKTLAKAKTMAIRAIEKKHSAICLKILQDGDVASATLMSKMVSSLGSLWAQAEINSRAAKDKVANTDKTKLLTIAADAMYCVAVRYDEEKSLRSKGNKSMIIVAENILIRCERFYMLALRADPKRFPSAFKLKSPEIEVLLAVDDWLKDLEKHGVTFDIDDWPATPKESITPEDEEGIDTKDVE